ncbi:MAG: ATP-binding protein [Marinoscillum sp.]
MRVSLTNILGVFLLTILFLVFANQSNAQYFSADVFKDQRGMASNRITNITQAYSGEVWIGTRDGLSYYDGLSWNNILGNDSLNFAGNIHLSHLADSTLIAISTGAGANSLQLYKHNQQSWSKINTPQSLSELVYSGNIKVAASINDFSNQLILGHSDSIYFLQEDQWRIVKVKSGEDKINIRALKQSGDSLFIVTNKGLLLYYNDQYTSLIDHSGILNVTYNPDDSIIYVSGEDWVGSYNGDKLTSIFQNRPIGLFGSGAFTCLLYRDHKIYYSFNSPLHQYDLKTGETRQLITQYFDTDYSCMDALFDHEGSLWIATLRGTFRVKNLNIVSYNSNQLLENEVSAALQTKNGDLYLGSNIGLTIIRSTGKIEKYPFPKHLLQPRVMDMIIYQEEVYLAANSAGVVRFANGKLHYDKFLGEHTRALDLMVYEDQLYALSNSNLYRRKKEGDWPLFYRNNQFSNGVIRKVVFNEDHKILLTDNGVIDFEQDKLIRSFDPKSNNIYCSLKHDGEILLGTTGGIMVLDQDTIQPKYDIKKPFYALTDDTNGYLWAGSGQGTYCISDSIFVLSKVNGMSGNEVNRNAFFIMNSGQLLVGTDEGVSIVNTNMDRSITIPRIEFLGALANANPVDFNSDLTHQQNNLRFQFRSVSFVNSKEINFRVKLSGLNPHWQKIDYANQNSILFTNLKPGKYQFVVQSRIANGPWSRVAKSPVITIRNAFYQTYWFRTGLVLLIISIFATFFTLRSKSLSKRNEHLQLRVDEKTQELKAQNDELLKAINELKSAQGQLIQSEKLASMGHLTSGIAHELNNPLNYIRGGAECIIRNMKDLAELKGMIGQKKTTKQIDDFESIMDDSMRLAESILEGASKSTEIVKSLGSFTADSQNFYSFTDLQKAVDTALTLLSSEIGFRIIINKMFGNIPPIECYPAKVNQLLVNILLNAIQSISERGEITIRYYRKDDQRVGIEISDDGVGIPEDLKEKVFEPFFTTKDLNPGLGLTIAKSIVQEHHGSIEIKSVVGKGTKVIIMLPVSQTFHPELEGFETN